MDKLLSIRAFVAVVDTGGFTSAAEILPISRAGVSKHLSDLETGLGARLLHRTTRRISLTAAGKAYYEKSKQILEAVDEAEALVTGISGTPKGLLRINAPMSFGKKWIGPALASFCKTYPGVEIDITLSDRQIDIIEEGYDATIRITRPSDSSLVARKLSPCRFLLAAAPAYLNASGIPESIKDLQHHNCLRYHYRPNRDLWTFQHDKKEITVKVSGSMTTNNGDLICSAGVHGMGIVMLPTFILCEAVESGKLIPILKDSSILPSSIYVVYPTNRLLSEKVRIFSEFMVRYFDGTPQWDQTIMQHLNFIGTDH